MNLSDRQEQVLLVALGLTATCVLVALHANELAMVIGGGVLGFMTRRPTQVESLGSQDKQ